MTIKSIILFSLVLHFSLSSISQDASALIREAQSLEKSRKETDAFKKYLEVLAIQPRNLEALCKASEMSSLIGHRQPKKTSKLDYFKAARNYAEAALRVNPNYSEANFVMAMAMGRMALLLSGREKIMAVNDIKKYAENAVKNDPRNFKAFHVLGKWHYEVSSLSGFERMAARLLFGGLPPSTFEESIRNYEKSRLLSPTFALNYLEIAKAYHKNDQDEKAIEVLRKLQTLAIKNADDPRIKREGGEMLKELD